MMARSPTEIPADMAVARELIEHGLDALQRHLPSRAWLPFALVAAGLVGGLVVSRLPLWRILGLGTRTIGAGMTVGSALAAAGWLLGEYRSARPLGFGRPLGDSQ